MKIQELRIGNYVNYFGHPITIKEVEINVNFKAIPITEEWLLKFGFEKCKMPDMYEIKPNINGCECFSFHSDYNSVTISDGFGNDYLVKNIQYIHQLQNLFYSITQKELQIK